MQTITNHGAPITLETTPSPAVALHCPCSLSLVTGPINIDPTDPEVLDILSTLCFEAAPIAHILQRAGYEIPRKAEAEQAHVILWKLALLHEHGNNWREEGQKKLNAMKRPENDQALRSVPEADVERKEK